MGTTGGRKRAIAAALLLAASLGAVAACSEGGGKENGGPTDPGGDGGGGGPVFLLSFDGNLPVWVPTRATIPLAVRVQLFNGSDAADGTRVDFTQSPALGTITPPSGTTSGGWVRATFEAGQKPGAPLVTATCGEDSAELLLNVTAERGTPVDPQCADAAPCPQGGMIGFCSAGGGSSCYYTAGGLRFWCNSCDDLIGCAQNTVGFCSN